MYNVGLIVWVGIIALAVATFFALQICKSKREGPVLVIREEGETVIPCTEDRLGGDDVYTEPEVRKCKYCGKPIRKDRWFCSLAHKKLYMRLKGGNRGTKKARAKSVR